MVRGVHSCYTFLYPTLAGRRSSKVVAFLAAYGTDARRTRAQVLESLGTSNCGARGRVRPWKVTRANGTDRRSQARSRGSFLIGRRARVDRPRLPADTIRVIDRVAAIERAGETPERSSSRRDSNGGGRERRSEGA